VPKHAETTSQGAADVACSNDSDFHNCFALRTSFQLVSQTLDSGENVPPKRDASVNERFDWSGVLPSQFLHFCGTWEVGWPFCRDQQLRPVHRPCGLSECLDPDIEFNLVKDENLGGNEPDCETNQERPERE
jgi:hypothetical protein